MKPTAGIPCWMINDMQWSHLEELSGNSTGSYPEEPVRVYREFQLAMGTCYIDQWLPGAHMLQHLLAIGADGRVVPGHLRIVARYDIRHLAGQRPPLLFPLQPPTVHQTRPTVSKELEDPVSVGGPPVVLVAIEDHRGIG